ncbi:RsmB/NOP family class I SAM-dependent RNA methyltransferase [Marinivivus vitaminiproducens]|uniref:RsmB/NOP family class I SAM-dependent RNA methyltransferase n=1 Tax=Marinivivus vitaminiproducens TaxID=3035935 RepID=UPI0027A04F9F|nr:transcription antitermination factor NusB [Geminicoccaceae bacterium SCSIO 64248]
MTGPSSSIGRRRNYVWRQGEPQDEQPGLPRSARGGPVRRKREPEGKQPPANPRRVALDVLTAVFERKLPLDEALASARRLPELETRDRAFVRMLVATTLRRLGQIDAVLKPRLNHAPKEPRTRHTLRMGAAQLLFMDTPAHAAVGQSVELAGKTGPQGLINAVLRRIATDGPGEVAEQDAERLNTPNWLWHAWVDAYGQEATRAIARVHMAEPSLDFSIKGDRDAWASRLAALPVGDATLRRHEGGQVEELAGYKDGAWWIQDAAAALPARLLGDVSERDVLDLCAAPGGKTAQLAVAGARVTAIELSEARAERLRANLRRLKLDAELVVADALAWEPGRRFARVLLDAPCSATGTIRRHPDVAWNKTPDTMAQMTDTQKRLLDRAASWLEPGGTLVYAVCSLQPEEGPDIVAAVLAERSELERQAIAPDERSGLPVDVTEEGAIRTLPCHLAEQGGMDGFYIARLRRKD